MNVFQETSQFKIFAMNTMEHFPKTAQGNQYDLVISDLFSKLTRAISTFETTSAHFLTIFLVHWVVPFSIPAHSSTAKGAQFLGRFFSSASGCLGLK